MSEHATYSSQTHASQAEHEAPLLDAVKARELTNLIEGEVRLGVHDRMLYATDASLYQVEPLGVVIPANLDDACRAIAWCGREGIAMLPRGGGTSLAGQCTNRAMVIDFSPNCRGVGAVDVAARTVRAEPGVTLDDLNDQIAGSGLFFAPDPATSKHANLGGCIGNNAAGARSIRYKRTSENVLAIEACLADGRRVEFRRGAAARDDVVRELTWRVLRVIARNAPLIRERFPKTLRRSAGYQLDVVLKQVDEAAPGWIDAWAAGDCRDALPDQVLAAINLSPLLCGSEGTLAFTLGAILALHPRPKSKALATLGFASLDEAIAATVPILATNPTAVELLDDTVIDLALANAEYRRYAELMPKPGEGKPLKAVLYVEYFGASDAETAASVAALREVIARFEREHAAPGAIGVSVYTHTAEQLQAWKLRKAGEPLLHGIPGTRKPITFVEDNAVPVEHLSQFVKEFRDLVSREGTIAAYYAHASVGVLHIRPLIDIHDEHDRERMRHIAAGAAALAKKFGGVMSGEHGDGRVRTPFLADYYGPELMQAFRDVKRIFDPNNLLNPGNIVDLSGDNPRPVESITQRLRVLPAARAVSVPHDVPTYFDYTDQHDFGGAVEMCNGSGVCRKKQGGTMCPSYQATLDERHSTRGRGNALRLAITGQFGDGHDPDWNDPETIATLDLCLSCKACKTECPSNVDIARLKAEYTAQRYRTQGVPFDKRLMGEVRLLNRLGSIAPGLANAANRWGPVRSIINAMLKLHPRRSLPPFARSLASQWGSRATPQANTSPAASRVVLFGDCFTMYNEPGIGLATREVFEAFGYRVELANAGCCGRAKISMGLLEQAQHEVDATIERLAPYANDESVAAILVTEPSCLSALKDDWQSLKLAAPATLRKAIAAKAWLPEDFLERRWDAHPKRPAFAAPRDAVILHGHCHQKALWGVQTSGALLKRLTGDKLTILDSGCCGMAGSFGYTRDRFELSNRIGELVLFPAVRKSPEATVCAPGTSCRHQIHDGVGRRAMHPIELVHSLLAARKETHA